jgi:hypothetical protein
MIDYTAATKSELRRRQQGTEKTTAAWTSVLDQAASPARFLEEF